MLPERRAAQCDAPRVLEVARGEGSGIARANYVLSSDPRGRRIRCVGAQRRLINISRGWPHTLMHLLHRAERLAVAGGEYARRSHDDYEYARAGRALLLD